jgi:hypothetical protein
MIAIFDIDHTLSDAAHRDHLIGGDWDVYHSASVQDKPIEPMRELCNSLFINMSWRVIGLTTRPEKFRILTIHWLHMNKIFLHDLLMRPDDDFRPTDVVKLELFQKAFPMADKMRVMIFDDRDSVIKAFREAGIAALHVHAGGMKDDSKAPN